MKIIYLLLLHIYCQSFCAQTTNEINIFSFQSIANKTISLSLDTVSNILIFKNGAAKENLIVVKDALKDESPVFIYSYYFRGGGKDNAGLDLNYVRFNHENRDYELFDEFSAEDEAYAVGLRINDLGSGYEHAIEGKYESIRGSIIDFRWNEMIPVEY